MAFENDLPLRYLVQKIDEDLQELTALVGRIAWVIDDLPSILPRLTPIPVQLPPLPTKPGGWTEFLRERDRGSKRARKDCLTEQELEVCGYRMLDYSDGEIARAINEQRAAHKRKKISVRTVASHIQGIRRKFGLSRADQIQSFVQREFLEHVRAAQGEQ